LIIWQEKNFTTSDAAMLLSAAGIGNTLGRVLGNYYTYKLSLDLFLRAQIVRKFAKNLSRSAGKFRIQSCPPEKYNTYLLKIFTSRFSFNLVKLFAEMLYIKMWKPVFLLQYINTSLLGGSGKSISLLGFYPLNI